MDISTLAMGGNNIALGVSDVNSTTTRHPSLFFTVIDNLQVTDAVPEPGAALIAAGTAGIAMVRRRRRRA